MEKLYNTYIVKIDKSAESLIGENQTEARAEKREESGLMRIDSDNYFVCSHEVGSKEDKKYQKQLTKIK